jgi:hypothetical protein
MENVLTAVMTMRPSYLPLSVAEMKLILRAPFECNETLQECTTLAELLTASQDLCEAHTRALRGQISLSKIFAGQST